MTDRSAPLRWYVDGGTLIGRQKDTADERIELSSLPAALRIEGYVAMRSKGMTHAEIVSGENLPDRTLPSTGSGRVTEDSKWRSAIAHAVAEEDTGKAGLVGVSREAKEAALSSGQEYAATLSKQDVRDYQGKASVMAWYARLFGEKDRIRKPAPLAEAAE